MVTEQDAGDDVSRLDTDISGRSIELPSTLHTPCWHALRAQQHATQPDAVTKSNE
jgi:hypothetical protein